MRALSKKGGDEPGRPPRVDVHSADADKMGHFSVIFGDQNGQYGSSHRHECPKVDIDNTQRETRMDNGAGSSG